MSLLDTISGRPVRLPPLAWAMADLLGQARMNTNKNRAACSNRGEAGNRQVDLLGALAELIVLRQLQRLDDQDGVRHMQEHLFCPTGGRGVVGADVCTQEAVFDLKSFDCAPNKRFMAINVRKHEELQGSCQGYMVLIAAPYAKLGGFSHLVPHGEVSRWTTRMLRTGGSLCHILPMPAFLSRYAPRCPDPAQLRPRAPMPPDAGAYAQARQDLGGMLPALKDWMPERPG